mgnify:CR=1 FL=1
MEGQIDCIKCHSIGLKNTIALTGSALTPYQIFLLKRKSNNFHFILDSDVAGKKAVSKIKKKYSEFINIKVSEIPPPYEDVDDYISNSNDLSFLENINENWYTKY